MEPPQSETPAVRAMLDRCAFVLAASIAHETHRAFHAQRHHQAINEGTVRLLPPWEELCFEEQASAISIANTVNEHGYEFCIQRVRENQGNTRCGCTEVMIHTLSILLEQARRHQFKIAQVPRPGENDGPSAA